MTVQRTFYYIALNLSKAEVLFDSKRSYEFSVLLQIQYPKCTEKVPKNT